MQITHIRIDARIVFVVMKTTERNFKSAQICEICGKIDYIEAELLLYLNPLLIFKGF